ncbi:MAG: DUF58 domain-containing protein [Planctomycetes bacterium]|nr:DUF58 domain-containing protein [Planctomycetota bacterium]
MKPRTKRWSFRVNGRGWIFLALSASVAFAAALKGNNLLFAIFCVLIAQFVVSGVLTVIVARGIELSRLLPSSATAGGLFTVGIRLRNLKKFWPVFCLRIEDRVGSAARPVALPPTPVWIPMAGARKRIRTACYATAPERGWARLGPFTVVSEFTPGLFTYRRVVPVVNRLLVYPRLGLLNRRFFDALLAKVEYSELAAHDYERGHEEFAGLREFREGDSPRDIHWKMSARVPERLLVREHDDPRVRDVALLLETHIPRPGDLRRRGRLERAIPFAATLAEALLGEGYRVRFRAFAPAPLALDLDPRAGNFEDLLRELALLRPSRTHTMAELLAAEESPKDEVIFLLRIGDEPVPQQQELPHARTLTPADMKALMDEPAAEGEEAETS